MKFIIANAVAILALAGNALAGPVSAQPGKATITLSNEFSGANANALVPTDGTQLAFSSLFASSALNQNGAIKASSVALNGITPGGITPNGPKCTIRNGAGQTLVVFGDSKTYYRFGSDPNTLQVVDVTYDSVSCQ